MLVNAETVALTAVFAFGRCSDPDGWSLDSLLFPCLVPSHPGVTQKGKPDGLDTRVKSRVFPSQAQFTTGPAKEDAGLAPEWNDSFQFVVPQGARAGVVYAPCVSFRYVELRFASVSVLETSSGTPT